MYQQLMDCIVVRLLRATRRTANGLPTENGMPSSGNSYCTLTLIVMYQQLMDCLNCIVVRLPRATRRTADGEQDAVVAPWVSGSMELGDNARMRQIILCCSPTAGRETECRRSADGVRVRNGMPSSPRQPLNNARMRRQFILYINADCTNN